MNNYEFDILILFKIQLDYLNSASYKLAINGMKKKAEVVLQARKELWFWTLNQMK